MIILYFQFIAARAIKNTNPRPNYRFSIFYSQIPEKQVIAIKE
jgi:hypothetical protein